MEPVNDISEIDSYTPKSMREVLASLNVSLTPEASKQNDPLLRFIECLDRDTFAAMRDLMKTYGVLLPKRKRRQRAEEQEKSKRLKIDQPDLNGTDLQCRIEELKKSHFMTLPSSDEIQECMANFIYATGNQALATAICAACAQITSEKKLQGMAIDDIPHGEMLAPREPHPAHFICNGMLLHKDAIKKKGIIPLCNLCLQSLQQGIVPRLSLANDMWIGDIPFEMEILTLAERMLLARYFPVAYVIKLFPKKKGSTSWDKRGLNSALRMNVSTHPLPQDEICDIMDPQSNEFPADPCILAATIAVTFVGPKGIPKTSLPKWLRVRRTKVLAALIWLRNNNPLYRDINLNADRIAQLPEDDIPDEILMCTRQLDNEVILDEEHDTYIPPNDTLSDTDEDIEGSVPETLEEPCILRCTSGVLDMSADSVSDSDLLAHALSNLTSGNPHSEDFVIKHGSAFVNEWERRDEKTGLRSDGGPANPNHLLGCFPWLFPYGKGGFEVFRRQDVPYEMHARWTMTYADKRFRRDERFVFQVFGVVQKRLICRSAALQVKRASYRGVETALLSLKRRDFEKASQEEALKQPFSNPVMKSLRGQVSAIRARVPGTNEYRTKMRAKVWSTIVQYGPPSLWITINPSDTQNPIAQVLAGENIDLDNFLPSMSPNAAQRAINVAEDPYASAKFFEFVMEALLEHMFGLISYNGYMKRKIGVMGRVRAFIFAKEVQGRGGAPHGHGLIWLEDAPTSQLMEEALKHEDFRLKVAKFVQALIHADIDDKTEEEIKAMPVTKSPSNARPIDPKTPGALVAIAEQEKQLARSLQYHVCHEQTCLRYVNRILICKRGIPFQESDKVWVSALGEWAAKRTCGRMNNWCPYLLWALFCNNDIKLILNAGATKNITFYVGTYQFKNQPITNLSALLAKQMAFGVKSTDAGKVQRVRDVNKRLLTKCANTLNKGYDIPATEIVALLMGWGITIESHTYTKLYWDVAFRALLEQFPQLMGDGVGWTGEVMLSFSSCSLLLPTVIDTLQEVTQTLQLSDGKISLKDQLKEYSDRGHELDATCFFHYIRDTYDGKEAKEHTENTRGRHPNKRVPYLPQSGRKGCRVFRQSNHETIVQFIGRWLPNRSKSEDREKYCAAMLLLFRPWRNLSDIKRPGDTFAQTFLQVASTWPEEKLDLLDNIQYYHESISAARDHDAAFPVCKTSVEVETIMVDGCGIAGDESVITEDMISLARANAGNAKAKLFSDEAIQAARDAFVFQIPNDPGTPMPQFQNRATPQQLTSFLNMTKQLKQLSSAVLSNDVEVPIIIPSIERGLSSDGPSVSRIASDLIMAPATSPSSARQGVQLSSDQQLAFDIICNHMRATRAGCRPPQLLMILQGYGGTGKTTLINEITKTFEANDYKHSLAKTAMSGIAATIIDAVTLHWWVGINANSGKGENWVNKAGAEVRKRRSNNVDGKHYLIVDEFSMLTKQMLACVSEVVTSVAMNLGIGDDKLPFGGLNVILAGDPHQFPPVGNPTGALYVCLPNEIGKGAIGRMIYEQFETVVTLEEQKRVTDAGWNDMLLRLREGACTLEDVQMVESLILANCTETTRFDQQPWNRCVLLTPRNATRNPWNAEFATRMFIEDRRWIYVSKAEDIPCEGQLSMHDRWLIAGAGQVGTSKLEETLEVAVGMRVMILINLSTQAEVANGTRGTVEDIVLDPREPEIVPADNGRVFLQYPPALLVFRPDSHAKLLLEFPGLPRGCIPITPREEGFRIKLGNNRKSYVRRQFAMTAAYAFTHEKSQGQTLDRVVVDLANPGTLTPFHAYVSLSRARGRDHIRILRKFDRTLLTTHPSEHLKEEDKRLKILSELTKKNFAAGMYKFGYR